MNQATKDDMKTRVEEEIQAIADEIRDLPRDDVYRRECLQRMRKLRDEFHVLQALGSRPL